MGQADTAVMNDRNLKPHDEDSDFPEFEFPVGDSIDTTTPVLPSERFENGNGKLHRAHIDESPKKMPLAVTARLSSETEATVQPEISKHVVMDSESRIPNPVLASSRKVLSSNPSFKSLVTHLGEPLKFSRTASLDRRGEGDQNGETGSENGHKVQLLSTASKRLSGILARSASMDSKANGDQNGDSKVHALLSTPSSKRLSGILARESAKIEATKSPERTQPVPSTVGVNVLVERLETFSAGAKNPKLRDDRAVSPGPRNLVSPRRVMADPSRSRSPTPRQLQQQESSTARSTISSPRRGSARVERSVSPVPRSWKDSVYGDMPKDRRPSLSKPDPATTPPPRFLTPTQAATMKTVRNNPNSKSLQFTTAFGITTPVKQAATPTVTKATLSTATKQTTPAVTKPAGFNFRTDERAERRKDFYTKLEERLKVKETEKKRADLKAQEEKEAQLRELRKSLTYKANPVPRFYQEPAPVPAEIQKVAPTRAKSPNFTAPRRRDSCPASELGRISPLRSSRALTRCDSASSASTFKAPLPKPKQPFRPV